MISRLLNVSSSSVAGLLHHKHILMQSEKRKRKSVDERLENTHLYSSFVICTHRFYWINSPIEHHSLAKTIAMVSTYSTKIIYLHHCSNLTEKTFLTPNARVPFGPLGLEIIGGMLEIGLSPTATEPRNMATVSWDRVLGQTQLIDWVSELSWLDQAWEYPFDVNGIPVAVTPLDLGTHPQPAHISLGNWV